MPRVTSSPGNVYNAKCDEITSGRERRISSRSARRAAIRRNGSDCPAEPKPLIAPPVSAATFGEPATTPRTATPAPGSAPLSE
jgi:hypothetical protein